MPPTSAWLCPPAHLFSLPFDEWKESVVRRQTHSRFDSVRGSRSPKRTAPRAGFTPDGRRIRYAHGPLGSRYRRRARIWVAVAVVIVIVVVIAVVALTTVGFGSSTVPGPEGSGSSHTDWPAWIAALTGIAALCLSSVQALANFRKARRAERQAAAEPGYQPDRRSYL